MVLCFPFNHQVFRQAGQLTCFDISKNMLKRTHEAVGEEPCAGGGKVSFFPRWEQGMMRT